MAGVLATSTLIRASQIHERNSHVTMTFEGGIDSAAVDIKVDVHFHLQRGETVEALEQRIRETVIKALQTPFKSAPEPED